jgi:uncharacterized protein (TIGR00730 family)
MNIIQTLTVYLGSSGHARPVFNQTAADLGRYIGKHGMKLVYGGMDAGLMGILAQSALNAGAHVTDSERILHGLNETILVQDLWERKRRMFLAADAIVSLPGGFGTLDESLEVLYWGNLKLHNKPLALVNIEGYWNDLISYIRTLPDFDERFLIVVDTLDELFPALKNWSFSGETLEVKEGFPHFEGDILRDTNEPIALREASIQSSYFWITAVGLKQLGKHARPMGLINDHGQFDGLIAWIDRAADETFITQKCKLLFGVYDHAGDDMTRLLSAQEYVHIDLHNEKWGKSEV